MNPLSDVAALAAAAKERLSPGRWQHVAGVVQQARRLAEAYGVSEQLTEAAAWAHDLWREVPPEEILLRAERLGLPILPVERKIPLFLHGPLAAVELALAGWPESVVEAVRVHTTGRSGMDDVASVLYVADKIEPGRRHQGVDRLRRIVGDVSLSDLVLNVLISELTYLLAERRPLHPWALALYQERVEEAS